MKRAFAWLLASLVVVSVLIVPLGISIFRATYYEPKIRAADDDLRSFFPRIEADLKALAAHPIFENVTRLQNAAPFLVEHVGMVGVDARKLATPSHLALRKLFAENRDWQSSGDKFERFAASPEIAQVDAAWVGKLGQFDHLDEFTIEPLATVLRSTQSLGTIERIFVVSNHAILNLNEALQFATVHVIQQQKSGAGLAGLRDLHKLAQLFQSQPSLLGQMEAASALGRERSLAELLKLTDWKSVEQERSKAFQRLAWVWPGLIRMAESRGFPPQFEAYLEPRFGACAGAVEATSGLDSFFDYLEPRALFESDFHEEIENGRKFKRQVLEKCGLSNWTVLLSSPPAGVPRAKSPAGTEDMLWLRHMPYVRRLAGMILVTMGRPDAAKRYKED